MNRVHLETALLARKLGLSPVPPKEDGSKAPIGEWKEFQKTPASTQIIRVWYRDGRTGNGLVCGVGNLECFEFDHAGTFSAFLEAAWAIGLGELVNRIRAGYEESTPGGGVHWLYRCDTVGGNTKLACRYKTPEEFTDSDRKAIAKTAANGKEHNPVKTLIETRGKGGFVVTAPSNGKVHPTGGVYTLVTGGLEAIATITAEERDSLWELARTFDGMPAAVNRQVEPKTSSAGVEEPPGEIKSPGDDYEEGSTWADVLEPFGWEVAHTSGGVTYWRRPGKGEDWSATTGHCKGLKVFSSSTPFSTEGTYTKFGAYTTLNHGGDYSAAAKALAEKGYGSPSWAGRGNAPRADAPSSSPTDPSTEASSVHATERKKDRSQADILKQIAATAKLFKTPAGDGYATIKVNGRTEHHPVDSRAIELWLTYEFMEKEDRAPSGESLSQIVSTIKARALFSRVEIPVGIRVAPDPAARDPLAPVYYLDLNNETGLAVKISAEGWTIVDDPPVKFRRTKGMGKLPMPDRSGSLELLREFVNIDKEDWILFVAALTHNFLPVTPQPIRILAGEQGSCKSTTTEVMKRCVDPYQPMLGSPPSDIRDLVIIANSTWVLAFDNLSSVRPWFSDAICRLAYGVGFQTRTLCTNDELTSFQSCRPVIINGIDDLVARHDALNRALILNCPILDEKDRRADDEFWLAFEKAHPEDTGIATQHGRGRAGQAPHTGSDHLSSHGHVRAMGGGCLAASRIGTRHVPDRVPRQSTIGFG